MEDKEKRAIQTTLLALLDDLNPNDVAPYLFQYGHLTRRQYEELIDSNLSRHKRCQRFLNLIMSESGCCTFQGLLAALRYNGAYVFLANTLDHQVQVGSDENRNNEAAGQIGSVQQTRSRDGFPGDGVSHGNESSTTVQLCEPVKKIDVFKENRVKMSELAHKLKRLSHDGNVDKFRQLVTKIDKIYKKNKLNSVKDIEERMEFADMRFIALEAEASSRRVNYDVTLYGNQLFEEIESVIPYTTNPRVSSMTYLARYGSAVSMLESIDNGLAILQYSKHHAEHVVPCKETGMVYYIEVNLLSQKYEKEPNADLKMKILKTAEVAISQFNGEDELVQKDYQRMLMLKMVFCRLGIGLFGNKIESVNQDDADIDSAKDYLDFIEKPDVWNGMEKRRKMLFQVAKSELYRQRNQYELALPHAIEAARLAEENRWGAELPNLQKRLTDLEDEMKLRRSNSSSSTRDHVDRWLDEFDDDTIEIESLTLETDDNRVMTDQTPHMQNLKPPRDQLNGGNDQINMTNLKSVSWNQDSDTKLTLPQSLSMAHMTCAQQHDNIARNQDSDIKSTIPPSLSMTSTTRAQQHDNMLSMDLLKQHQCSEQSVDVNTIHSINMTNLKCFSGIQETGCDVGTALFTYLNPGVNIDNKNHEVKEAELDGSVGDSPRNEIGKSLNMN